MHCVLPFSFNCRFHTVLSRKHITPKKKTKKRKKTKHIKKKNTKKQTRRTKNTHTQNKNQQKTKENKKQKKKQKNTTRPHLALQAQFEKSRLILPFHKDQPPLISNINNIKYESSVNIN